MKFTPLLILTLFLIFSSGQSQTIISGKIININNQALFGATVTLSPDSTGTIPAYGISDANENYRVKLASDSELVLKADGFKKKLIAALNRPKPFRNFNYLIHESDFRQEWFDFRQERNVEWVKEQISNLSEE